MLSFKAAFSLSSFTFIKRLCSSFLLCAIRVVSSACLRLFLFPLAILIPACASSSLAFCVMYSAYSTSAGSCNGAQAWAMPRGAPPRLKSGAEAGRTPCPRGGGKEELPHIRGKGQQPRVPGCNGAGMAERSYPTSEVGGSGREEKPHVQGVVAVPGTGGPGGAIPCSRSGGAVVRRYPSSKVKSSGCALLEQL